jgi:large subunit ribosomal protein L18
MDHLQQKKKWDRRQRKTLGIRRRLRLSSDRPRLTVFRSAKHISAQVIDDLAGRTLASASDVDKDLREQFAGKKKSERAVAVGKLVAQRALQAGITEVKFDRGWYLFHGRIKALAEAAREGGLKF